MSKLRKCAASDRAFRVSRVFTAMVAFRRTKTGVSDEQKPAFELMTLYRLYATFARTAVEVQEVAWRFFFKQSVCLWFTVVN